MLAAQHEFYPEPLENDLGYVAIPVKIKMEVNGFLQGNGVDDSWEDSEAELLHMLENFNFSNANVTDVASHSVDIKEIGAA